MNFKPQVVLCALLLMTTTASSMAATSTKKAPKKPTTAHHTVKAALPPLAVAPPPAPAAAADKGVTAETPIYDGTALDGGNADIGSWGGGSAEDSTNPYLTNGHSIKVVTRNLFEGAVLTFHTPVAVPSPSDGKNHVIDFKIRFAQPSTSQAMRTPAPAFAAPWDSPSMVQLAQFGGRGRGGRGGRGGGGGRFPFPGMRRRPSYETITTYPVNNLHVQIRFSDGHSYDGVRTVPTLSEVADSNLDAWVDMAIPLKVVCPNNAAPKITSIRIAGDTTATMYIGSIGIYDDEAPITAFAGDSQDVSVDNPVALHGSATGGLSSLHYAWNFGTTSGTEEQASGADVTNTYRTGGKEYTVTLTVSDVDGIKSPAVSTTTVKVEE